MAAVIGSVSAKHGILSRMLRTDGSAYYICEVNVQTSGGSNVKYKINLTGSSWGSVADGSVSLTVPLLLTNQSTGTIAKSRFMDTSGSIAIITDMVCAASGDREMYVDDDTIVSSSDPCNVTGCAMYYSPGTGTVKLNTALRERLLTYLTGKDTSSFAAAGTIKIYSGSAPASADDAATGTELASFTTSTTSWAAPSSGSSALAASLGPVTASGGSSTAGGYARFAWSTYVIQGSIGTSGTDFVINDNTFTSGVSSHTLTAATMAF